MSLRTPGHDPALSPPRAGSRKGPVLLLCCLAQLMVVLDASIVNVALPRIQVDVGFSRDALQWIVNGYTLIFGGFLLLGGRAADLLGRRRVLLAGLAIFVGASIAGGLAQSEGLLIFARCVQGLGGAIISPAALSILTTTFAEGRERERALGVWSAIAGGAVAVGVVLGGLLTQGPGWRFVFFVNAPIGVATAVLGARLLASDRPPRGRSGYDVGGALTVTAGLMVLVYTMVRTGHVGWGSPRTIVGLVIAVALLSAFVAIEARSVAPLVPLRIFGSRSLSGGNLVALLVGMALFAVFFFLTLYFQQVLGYSPITAGLAYLPFCLGVIAASGIASALVRRTGVGQLLSAGLVVLAFGLFLLARVPEHARYVAEILPALVLIALGIGASFVPLTLAAVSGVADADAGLASALLNTSQQVGGAVGLALLSALATSRTASRALAGVPPPQALVDGFHLAFVVSGGLALSGVLVAVVFLRGHRLRLDAPVIAIAPAARGCTGC